MSKLFRAIGAMARANPKTAKIALVALAASLLLLPISAVPANAATKTFIALLNGGQEFFPPTSPPADQPISNALGVALMTFDTRTKKLCYSISFTPLVGTEFAAHFHGPAPGRRELAGPGISSGVRHAISPSPSPFGSPKIGCVEPRLTSREARDLERGLWYINVHSTTFGAGEIRGQVLQTR